jgi:hypothetical protein
MSICAVNISGDDESPCVGSNIELVSELDALRQRQTLARALAALLSET